MKMQVDFDVTDEMIVDQIITAVEGGSTYWCESLSPADDATDWHVYEIMEKGGSFKAVTHEDGDAAILLTRESIKEGLLRMQKEEPRQFANIISEDGDAITGDMFLQFCMLGELVYG